MLYLAVSSLSIAWKSKFCSCFVRLFPLVQKKEKKRKKKEPLWRGTLFKKYGTEMNGGMIDKVSGWFYFKSNPYLILHCSLLPLSCFNRVSLTAFDFSHKVQWNPTKANHSKHTQTHCHSTGFYVCWRNQQLLLCTWLLLVPNIIWPVSINPFTFNTTAWPQLRDKHFGVTTFSLLGSEHVKHLMSACWKDEMETTWALCAVCPVIPHIRYHFYGTPP